MLGAIGGAALTSLAGPRLRVRHEAEFLHVTVSAAFANGFVSVFVRARNTHTERRRVFTRWIDIAETVVAGGRLTTASGAANPRWLPIARTWRVPFEEEIAPGESRDLGLRIVDAEAGDHEGAVDVVLDGTTWVRKTVAFEVPGKRPGSGSDSIR